MSIDCERLLEYLLPFIKEKWNYWKGTIYEQDLDLVLWLTEVIVRHRPQDDCIDVYKRQGLTHLPGKMTKAGKTNKFLNYALQKNN